MSDEGEVQIEDVEREARSMGWVPQDKFKGNATDWVDADEFVDRGRKVLPILAQNNKRLQAQLLASNQKIGILEQQVQNATTAIDRLESHYSEANKRAVETARLELRAQLKDARENSDIDKEFEVQDKLRELDVSLAEADKKKNEKVEPKTKPTNNLTPEFIAWQKENPWFGGTSAEDQKKTRQISRIAEELRDDGNDLEAQEFLEECVRTWDDRYGDSSAVPTRKVSKVESGDSRPSGGKGSKGFDSLPEDAKKACLADAEILCGPGKRYKDLPEWKAAYAKIYHAE